jgi:hypothetical protein
MLTLTPTKGFSAARKRRGRCADLVMQMRRSLTHEMPVPAGLWKAYLGFRQRSVSRSWSPIPGEIVKLPGPEHSASSGFGQAPVRLPGLGKRRRRVVEMSRVDWRPRCCEWVGMRG